MVPNATPTHPSYTSGHASFGAALFGILEQFYGTDDVAFTLRLEEPGGGGTRSYSSFTKAQEENSVSRICLGVHWQFDSEDGDLEGTGVADYVYRNYLTLLPSGPGATPTSVAPILATAGAADSILSPPPSEGGPEFVFAPDTLTDELLLPFARSKKKKKT